jgi:hypothetical protein
MPPRYAYWTILIDGTATAFRAREREELLPTFNQLARKNADIAMRYFARGRLWDNPEQAQWANRNPQPARSEQRDRDWRPGGQHKDPRARFEKKTDRGERPRNATGRKPFESKYQKPFAPSERKPFQSPGARKPFPSKENRPLARDNKPFNPTDRKARVDHRPHKPEQRDSRDQRRERPKWQGKHERKPFGKPDDRKPRTEDRREPRADARPEKRPGKWSRPPTRKPR